MRALALLLLFFLPACQVNSTPVVESLALIDRLHAQDLDAFEALVKDSNAPQAAKDWYLDRIRQDRVHARKLMDDTVELLTAMGRIDWQTPALRAWEIYRSTR